MKKTTVVLADSLLRRAARAAERQGVSLSVFVAEAVESRLAGESSAPRWKRLHGGLASLRRENRRVLDRIEAEFENVRR